MKPLTISLCMIVKNEEKHLRKCLASVQDIVDEVIVVDTGSTDSTVAIAKEFNAKVFDYKWQNDFASARNFSISQTNADYILILDADEYLDTNVDLPREISSSKDYFLVNIKNYDSNGVTFYHQAVRLFRKESRLQFNGKLHEHLNVHDTNMNLSLKIAEFVIHHNGYLNEIIMEKNKKLRNLEIMQKEAEENPSAYNLFNLGNSYLNNDRLEEALDMYKKSFNMNSNVAYIFSMLCRMIETLRLLNRNSEAITLATAAIDRFPSFTDLYLLLGRIYEEMEYQIDAEIMYKKCIEIGDAKGVSYTMEGAGTYLPFFHLSDLYVKQGRTDEAFDAAYKSFQVNKHFMPAIKKYLEIMVNSNVPKADMFAHLRKVYTFTEIEDIKCLLLGLYETRNPLLYLYFSANKKANMDKQILAVAKLYDKQYEESLAEWLSLDKIDSTSGIDALLLALIINNNELLAKCEAAFNISRKEWDFVKNLVKRKPITRYIPTPGIEKFLLELCERSLLLGEYDVFEYVSFFILQATKATQIKLAQSLYNKNLNDVAQDLLLQIHETHPNVPDVIMLLGDISFKQGQFEESEFWFNQLRTIRNEYAVYERLHRVYERTDNIEGKTRVEEEIIKLFPLCRWVQQEIYN